MDIKDLPIIQIIESGPFKFRVKQWIVYEKRLPLDSEKAYTVTRIIEYYIEIASKPGYYTYCVDRNTFWYNVEQKVIEHWEPSTYEKQHWVSKALMTMWLYQDSGEINTRVPEYSSLLPERKDMLDKNIPANELLKPSPMRVTPEYVSSLVSSANDYATKQWPGAILRVELNPATLHLMLPTQDPKELYRFEEKTYLSNLINTVSDCIDKVLIEKGFGNDN